MKSLDVENIKLLMTERPKDFEGLMSKAKRLDSHQFSLETKIGKPNSINGLNDIIENPRYATTIGLIKFAKENDNLINTHNNSIDTGDVTKIFNKIKNFIKNKF